MSPRFMFLKRLDLQGFKTFASRTEIEFSGGLTCVVGPNGSGKCLTGDALVTLADGRDVPIRELVDAALSRCDDVETLDDGFVAREPASAQRVLSLDPATLRLEARPIAAFVKRTAPAALIRVRTRAGREVTATPYHPLFTLEAGHLRALRADELRVGTRLALPRRLPTSNPVALFALPRASSPNRDLVPGASELVRRAAHRAGISVKRHRSGRAKLAAYAEGRCAASRAGLLEVADQIEELAPGRATGELRALRMLASSDVYWDEVVSIETIEPSDPWVYDLCVDDTHNFVANNVVVHNS